MKQNIESRELDDYRVYLQGHLSDHYFPQRTDKKFIEERVENAYDCFITLRLTGKSVPYANEMAMRVLLAGLYVSRYDIIYNVVEENFWLRLPELYWPDFSVHLLGLEPIKSILDRYDVNGDFLSRETHQPMLTELIGTINEILDAYEL